jgi:hypothetical protein
MSCSPSPAEPARVVEPAERRRQQRSIVGGRRATDPPLTTRDCADWVGMDTKYIREEIEAGTLKAERFGRPGRKPIYRIHVDDFIAFLRTIGFQRLPKSLP